MMPTLLFTVYVAISLYLIGRFRFFGESGIPVGWLRAIFTLKVAAGLLYAYVHIYWKLGGDTYLYFQQSLVLFERLTTAPLHYLQLVFLPNAATPPEHLKEVADQINTWYDPTAYFMLRLNALMNIFSLGNYWVNIVIWQWLSFSGLVALYQFLKRSFISGEKLLLLFLVFTPSILFWQSGIHKGAVCVFGLGWMLYSIRTALVRKHWIWLLLAVFCWLTVLTVRPYVALLLAPPLLAKLWCRERTNGVLFRYTIVYILSISGVLLIGEFFPRYSFLNKLTYIQGLFVKYYSGDSDLTLPLLEPSIWSVLSLVPTALHHMFLRPFFTDADSLLILLAAVETLLVLFFSLYGFWSLQCLPQKHYSTFLFLFTFSLSLIILIGLTIDNLGAIVRYRALAYVFYLPAMLLAIHHHKKEVND